MMITKEITRWLLEGDISIQYQVYRDLLGINKPALQDQIQKKGWGAKFLALQNSNGYWGKGFYQPKWTSTHYTLLDLKNLNISSGNELIKKTFKKVIKLDKGADGGIYPIGSRQVTDVCINAMLINYACYFKIEVESIKSIIDFLLDAKLDDGGFNCDFNKRKVIHSSLHSTISVLEAITEYEKNGYKYRLDELKRAKETAQEFILLHRLFRSDRTNQVINPEFLKFHYPYRWHYDILRAMDYFQCAQKKYDPRMDEAFQIILSKKTGKNQWTLASRYPGKTHFDMEQGGKPSRWNTLRALKVLKYYNVE